MILPLLLLSLLGVSGPSGWRGDGSGVAADARPPSTWTVPGGSVRWSVPLPPGNGSPVWVAGKVCATAEPSTLACVDDATGALAWRARVEPVDALPAERRAEAEARRAAAESAERELIAARARYGALLRDARAGVDRAAELSELTTRMAALQRTIAAAADVRLPAGDGTVGWASPTPVARGADVWVAFSHGVVARFSSDGTRRWVRDLGRPSFQRRAYTGPPTASPVLAGPLLIVAHDGLVALDAATGAERWRTGPYPDFGTPAVVQVGARTLLATPDGRLLDAATGRVLQEGLGSLWYVGPYAVRDRLYYVGSVGDLPQQGTTTARAWRLVDDPAGPRVEPLWSVVLPTPERLYAGPVLWGDRLVVVTKGGLVLALDAATGKVVAQHAPAARTEFWPSPAVAGGRLYVTGVDGTTAIFDAPDLAAVRTAKAAATHATPLFVGERVYLRGVDALVAVGR